jgi:hypothetical protein
MVIASGRNAGQAHAGPPPDPRIGRSAIRPRGAWNGSAADRHRYDRGHDRSGRGDPSGSMDPSGARPSVRSTSVSRPYLRLRKRSTSATAGESGHKPLDLLVRRRRPAGQTPLGREGVAPDQASDPWRRFRKGAPSARGRAAGHGGEQVRLVRRRRAARRRGGRSHTRRGLDRWFVGAPPPARLARGSRGPASRQDAAGVQHYDGDERGGGLRHGRDAHDRRRVRRIVP